MDRSAPISSTFVQPTWLYVVTLFLGGFLFFSPGFASAHCDTLDGPVVNAARAALASGNPNLMLVWIPPKDEERTRRLFRRVQRRRADGNTESDGKLFASLVRIHREGEGVPFTGLKPAGQVEPSVAALDRSLAEGNAEPLVHALPTAPAHSLEEHVATLLRLRAYEPNDLHAGREYVAAYVTFAHEVEALAGGGENHEKHGAH